MDMVPSLSNGGHRAPTSEPTPLHRLEHPTRCAKNAVAENLRSSAPVDNLWRHRAVLRTPAPAARNEETSHARASMHEAEEPRWGNRLSVLIVDDLALQRQAIGRRLRSDFAIDSAASLELARKKLARRRYDVVILDLRLGDAH